MCLVSVEIVEGELTLRVFGETEGRPEEDEQRGDKERGRELLRQMSRREGAVRPPDAQTEQDQEGEERGGLMGQEAASQLLETPINTRRGIARLAWIARPARRMSLACSDESDDVLLSLYWAASATPTNEAPTTCRIVQTTSETIMAAIRIRGSKRRSVEPWWSRRRRAIPRAM